MSDHPTPELIDDYVHRALAPDADAAVHAHFEECSYCAALRDDERRLTDLLRSYGEASERELPAALRASILDACTASPTAGPLARLTETLTAALRPLIAVAVAAALAVAFYTGMHAVTVRPQPRFEASSLFADHAMISGTAPFSDGAVVPAALADDVDQ